MATHGARHRGSRSGWALAVLTASLLFVLLPSGAVGAVPLTYTVTRVADDANDTACTAMSCTLRQAVNAANANDPGSGMSNTILFALPMGMTMITLNGTYGQLTLSRSVTLTGPTGGVTVARSTAMATPQFRLLEVGGVTASLSNLTLSGGNPLGSSHFGNGGGIYNNAGMISLTNSIVRGNITSANGSGGGIFNDGTVTLTNSTVSGNTTTSANNFGGGGIFNFSGSTLTLTNSTVSGNNCSGADGNGGGIYNETSSTVTLTNSTMSGNTAGSGYGGGIYNSIGTTMLTSSTVSGNSASTTGGIFNSNGTTTITGSVVAGNSGSADVTRSGSSTVTDGGTNLIGTTSGATFAGVSTVTGVADPLLLPLGNYGGPTQTMPPKPGSLAVEGGTVACPANPITAMPLATDQRGLPRPVGRCDIGAVEYQSVAPLLGTVSLVGTAGQPLVLVGAGFQHGSTVAVDGVAATDIAVNADGTRLSLRLPAHAAGVVPFTVTNPGAGNRFSGFIVYATPAAVPTPRSTAAAVPNATPPAATAPRRTPGATPPAGTPTPAPQPTRRQG